MPLPPFSRNEKLGLVNGWIITLGDHLFSVSVVATGFVTKLGAPNWLIGLLPALYGGGWFLPQLPVAAYVRTLPLKLPVYRKAAFFRTSSYIAITLIAALLADRPALCLSLFMLALLINSLSSGVAGLPFLEVVSKTVPAAHRPRYFANRNLYGGLLAFGGGLLVRQILNSGLTFPLNYALIMGLATLAFTIGYWLFGLVEEPPDPPQPRVSWREEWKALPLLLREPPFQAFLGLRLLLAGATMSDPFYVANALRVLKVPPATLGSFVIAVTITASLSNLLWQRLAERRGPKRTIALATLISGSAPALALLVTLLHWPSWSYLGVFILTSLAAQGFMLGHSSHLLNIAPDHNRSRFIGLMNTLIGLALFAPVLGGLLADRWGYPPVFGLSVGLSALAWWQCRRL